MRTISEAERRARLARRHRLGRGTRAETVEDAVSGLVCLHATDAASVYLSARARVSGMRVEDMSRALYTDRSLVKQLAMRRTLFVFPRRMVAYARAGAGRQVAERERLNLIRDVEASGLHPHGEKWLVHASEQVLEALGDGREATAAELRGEVPDLVGSTEYGKGRSWGGQMPVAPRVLTVLSAEGKVVRSSNDGGWAISRPRFALSEAWLGYTAPTLTEEEGIAGLVKAWLGSFGPGTEADLKWWLGSTLGDVRKALADTEAAPVDLDGVPGYVLGGRPGTGRCRGPVGSSPPPARCHGHGLAGARLVPG